MKFRLADVILAVLVRFLQIFGLSAKICGSGAMLLGRLHLRNYAASFLVHCCASLVQWLVKETLWKQDFGRLRLWPLIVGDLGVSANRRVAGLVIVAICLLLLLRVKRWRWLLNLGYTTLVEGKIGLVCLEVIIIHGMVVSSDRSINSPVVLVQRLVPNTSVFARIKLAFHFFGGCYRGILLLHLQVLFIVCWWDDVRYLRLVEALSN